MPPGFGFQASGALPRGNLKSEAEKSKRRWAVGGIACYTPGLFALFVAGAENTARDRERTTYQHH